MAKQLKKFNGRAYCLANQNCPFWQALPGRNKTGDGVYAYIGAYSRADAVRLITEYMNGIAFPGLNNELKNYFGSS